MKFDWRVSKLDLGAIEARECKATLGPWTWEKDENLWSHGLGIRDYDNDEDNRQPIVQTDGGHYGPNADDAEFIAAARTDVSALVARVRELEQAADSYACMLGDAIQRAVDAEATIERVRMIATEYDSSESYATLRDIAALAGEVKVNV